MEWVMLIVAGVALAVILSGKLGPAKPSKRDQLPPGDDHHGDGRED